MKYNKKLLLLLFFLSGCVEPTAFLGPAVTAGSTGNIYQAGLNYGMNKTVLATTGKYPIEHLTNVLNKTKETVELAKNYKKEWEEYNKLSLRKKRNTPPPREDLELNILSEILDKKRFITCHSYVQSEINMLMHVGDSMGFTVNTFTHILEGYKVADKMKKHGAGGSTFSDWWAYKFEVNDAIPHNAALLNNAGVVTAINSDDAEMGRRLNHEAAKAIKYGGVSKEDAWKMITLNPAKLLKLDKKMGSLKVGKDADIVIWSDEPLSIYAKVESTFVDGRLLFDHNYNEKLMSRDQKEKARIISKMATSRGKKQKIKFEKEDLYHCCKHRAINYYE